MFTEVPTLVDVPNAIYRCRLGSNVNVFLTMKLIGPRDRDFPKEKAVVKFIEVNLILGIILAA